MLVGGFFAGGTLAISRHLLRLSSRARAAISNRARSALDHRAGAVAIGTELASDTDLPYNEQITECSRVCPPGEPSPNHRER